MPYDGNDIVCIYLAEEKLVKRLPKSRSISARRIVKEKNSGGIWRKRSGNKGKEY